MHASGILKVIDDREHTDRRMSLSAMPVFQRHQSTLVDMRVKSSPRGQATVLLLCYHGAHGRSEEALHLDAA